MNATEKELLERGWAALVDQLGHADATRFVMLLDRRTGGGVQHLQRLAMEARPLIRTPRSAAASPRAPEPTAHQHSEYP